MSFALETSAIPALRLPVIDATRENIADYGLFIGTDVPNSGLSIPFYAGTVVEGHNLPFVCSPPAVVRTAQVFKRSNEVRWLERHMDMTQVFIGLGSAPFVMVLGKPTHERLLDVPDLQHVRAFKIAPGHGLLLKRGTWHDFPMACADSVTVLTINSDEVVKALANVEKAEEMKVGDVFKIDVARRLGRRLIVDIP